MLLCTICLHKGTKVLLFMMSFFYFIVVSKYVLRISLCRSNAQSEFYLLHSSYRTKRKIERWCRRCICCYGGMWSQIWTWKNSRMSTDNDMCECVPLCRTQCRTATDVRRRSSRYFAHVSSDPNRCMNEGLWFRNDILLRRLVLFQRMFQ